MTPRPATYTLPVAHAAVLTDGPMSLAPIAAMGTLLGKHVHQVARAFREGGGVPYSEFRPEFTDVMDGISRVYFDGALIDGYVPLIDGLAERLGAGIRVADVACGTGHALVLLGRAFPASTFVGYDLDDGAIGRARAEAAGAQLTNVTFEVRDAARLRRGRSLRSRLRVRRRPRPGRPRRGAGEHPTRARRPAACSS